MALSASTIWEVRLGTGSATNGGGWVVGSSGTDWTQQAAAQYSVTDAVTNGTTTITSATANFGVDVVGNTLYIAGGTGSIAAGWYQIISRTNATTIVVDRSTGLTSGTGATLKIGGALDSLVTLAPIFVAQNKAFITGSGTQTATATFAVQSLGGAGVAPNRLIGYATTRGDKGQATITLSGASLTAVKITGYGFLVDDLTIDCASQTASTGIDFDSSGGFCMARGCLVRNFTSIGISAGATTHAVLSCEITGGTSAATFATNGLNVSYCEIHDNACPAIKTPASGNPGVIEFNRVTNNTGASSDGIQIGQYNIVVRHNTVHGNGRHGLYNSQGNVINCIWLNNIFTGNGGAGIQGAASNGLPADPAYDGNVFGSGATYGNAGGARVNLDYVAGINALNPYVNTRDITLSSGVSPYTNAAGGDFTLNNTAGGGAACRAAAIATGVAGAIGYRDMGAYQHQDAGGGTTTYVVSATRNYYFSNDVEP
jgi:hypothetical protein